jgi:serine/threonine-protein kinase
LSQPPSPLSERQLAAALPRGLEEVIQKCLAKDRARRYSDAAELAAALAPFGSDDARVSLTRVRGTLGSMASLPALVRSLPIDGATSIETTLPVATDPAVPHSVTDSTGPARTTSNISAPPPQSSRPWLAVGVVALIASGVVALRSLEPRAGGVPLPKVHAASSPAAVVGVATPSLLPTTPAPPSPAAPASAAPAPSASPTQPTAAARREPVKRFVIASPQPATRAAATGAASATSAESTPVTRASVAAPGASPSSSTASGRSAEIERLIEHRR